MLLMQLPLKDASILFELWLLGFGRFELATFRSPVQGPYQRRGASARLRQKNGEQLFVQFLYKS